LDTITWKRKTVEESITLSKALHTNASLVNQTIPVPDSTSSHAQDPLVPLSLSSHSQSPTSVTLPSLPAMQVPKPGDIVPPYAGLEAEGFQVITVSQEVGMLYHW
jgi:hypothetical protein